VGYRELSIPRNFEFGAEGFSKNLGLEYVHALQHLALLCRLRGEG
jgi:hypothetical protein